MGHRDENRDELQSEGRGLGTSSPSSGGGSGSVRGPLASAGAGDRAYSDGSGEPAERTRSARPRVAPNPGGPHSEAPTGETLDLPETYGVDEVEILCKDPWWYFAYWEVTDKSYEAAREQIGASDHEAKLVLRVFTQGPAGQPGTKARDGREIRDVPVQARHGRRYLEAPRSNALLRVAIGLLSPEGYFAPIAHSSVVRVPPQQPSSETAVEWLHVLPARGDGRQHERILLGAEGSAHQERTLSWQVQAGGEQGGRGASSAGGESLSYPGPAAAGGSSELGAGERGAGEKKL